MAETPDILGAFIRRLELYYLRKQGLALTGESYHLLLFLEKERGADLLYDIILSGRLLDNASQYEVMGELLHDFYAHPMGIRLNQYVNALRPVRSDSDLVRRMRQRTVNVLPAEPLRSIITEDEDGLPTSGWVYRSFLLERLRAGTEVRLMCRDGQDQRVWPVRLGHLDEMYTLHARLLAPVPIGTRLPEWVEYDGQASSSDTSNFRVPLQYLKQVYVEADFAPRWETLDYGTAPAPV